MDVRVEIIGPLLYPFRLPELPNGGGEKKSYGKVVLSVQPSDQLGTVLDRAAATIGLTFDNSAYETLERSRRDHGSNEKPSISSQCKYLAIRQPGLEIPEWEHYLTTIAVMDDNGAAEWHYHFGDITIGQLICAANEGLIDGDPTWLYLIPKPPGGGDIPAWEEFLRALNQACTVYAIPGALYATSDVIRRVYRKLKRGRDVATSEAGKLSDRHAGPEDVLTLLERRHWNTEQVARLLATDKESAANWLEMFGFRQDENGHWSRGGDLVSDAVVSTICLVLKHQIDWDAIRYSDDHSGDILKQIEAKAREHIAHIAEHGTAPQCCDTETLNMQAWEPPQ